MEPIKNRVEESSLMVLDLEKLWTDTEIVSFDLAPFLDRGLVLREKDFRQALNVHDWSEYKGVHVAIGLSTKAIVPKWAFMLVAAKLDGHAASIQFGSIEEARVQMFVRLLNKHDWGQYDGRNVVIKGCPSDLVPTGAYVQAMTALQNRANKVMYGEACSSVPVWRKPAEKSVASRTTAAKLPSRG